MLPPYGPAGNGTITHLAAEYFVRQAGVQVRTMEHFAAGRIPDPFYGCNELNLIAWQCPAGAGTYHVCDDAHVIEVVGPDGREVAVGELGLRGVEKPAGVHDHRICAFVVGRNRIALGPQARHGREQLGLQAGDVAEDHPALDQITTHGHGAQLAGPF